jgi:hypothetical protein
VDYLDFELEIGNASTLAYPVSVVRSPAGETREALFVQFDQAKLESRLKDLQIALLRSGGRHRQIPSSQERSVQDFGKELFNSVVVGDVRSRFDISLNRAVEQGKGLRIKLRIRAPQLTSLPWEYLYDDRRAEFLALSRDTPVVRYLEVPQPVQPLVIEPPLRILAMVASPRELPELDVEHERRRLDEAIARSRRSGVLHLEWLEGESWRDLQQAMRGETWHVFHFIGHGGFDPLRDEGFVAIRGEAGGIRALRATELGRLLVDHRALRLVVLNSCEGARGGAEDVFSSCASILIRRGLPAAIAMQSEISDRAAIEFSAEFYASIAEGLAVDVAVTEARKAISLGLEDSVEWGTPVLHMRSSDGALFTVQPGGRSERPSPEPRSPERRPPEPRRPEPGPAASAEGLPRPPAMLPRVPPSGPSPAGTSAEPDASQRQKLRGNRLGARTAVGVLLGLGVLVLVVWSVVSNTGPNAPGLYLRMGISRGEEIHRGILRAVPVPADEALPDRPLEASELVGFCALADHPPGHRLEWSDVGDCP